jgi:hypothetical protein
MRLSFFTALDAKIGFFGAQQGVFIAKTVFKSESVVRVPAAFKARYVS